jgi:hypothetical protein
LPAVAVELSGRGLAATVVDEALYRLLELLS